MKPKNTVNFISVISILICGIIFTGCDPEKTDPDLHDPNEETPAVSGLYVTGTVNEAGSSIKAAADKENSIIFSGDDIVSFNVSDGEIIFSEDRMEAIMDGVARHSELYFYIDSTPVFDPAIRIHPGYGETFEDFDLQFRTASPDIYERVKVHLTDVYMNIDTLPEAERLIKQQEMELNKAKRQKELDVLVAYLDAVGKIIDVKTEEPADDPTERPQDDPAEKPVEEPVTGTITMTAMASVVNISLSTDTATHSIVIDWGDGQGSKTYATEKIVGYNNLDVRYSYSNTSEHHITITGNGITRFSCISNQLTALDVSQNMALTELHCIDNQLTALDVSQNTALTSLYCYGNQLTALDVSQNTALITLYCGYNQLTVLDVSRNTPLRRLYCHDNQLTASTLNDLFISLRPFSFTKQLGPIDPAGWIYISDNPGTDTCDPGIAQAKGWLVSPYDKFPDLRP